VPANSGESPGYSEADKSAVNATGEAIELVKFAAGLDQIMYHYDWQSGVSSSFDMKRSFAQHTVLAIRRSMKVRQTLSCGHMRGIWMPKWGFHHGTLGSPSRMNIEEPAGIDPAGTWPR
jgi:hypothetical protein